MAAAPAPRLRWLGDHPSYADLQRRVDDYWLGYLPAIMPSLPEPLMAFAAERGGPLWRMHDAWLTDVELDLGGAPTSMSFLTSTGEPSAAQRVRVTFDGATTALGLTSGVAAGLTSDPKLQLLACELERTWAREFELRWLAVGAQTFGVRFASMTFATTSLDLSEYLEERQRREAAQPLLRRAARELPWVVQRAPRRVWWRTLGPWLERRRGAPLHATLMRWRYVDGRMTAVDEEEARWTAYDEHLAELLPSLPSGLQALVDPERGNVEELLHDALVVALDEPRPGAWRLVAICPNTRGLDELALTIEFEGATLLGPVGPAELRSLTESAGAGLDYVEVDAATEPGHFDVRVAPWDAQRPPFGFRCTDAVHTVRAVAPGTITAERDRRLRA